jgi:hypothetical protein
MVDSTAVAVVEGLCREAEVGGAEITVDQEATMDADLDTLCIAVYCTADDLLPEPPGNARRIVTDAEVVTLCVAQAIMGIRAPRANAFIERWVGTVRRDCLDRILIVNRRHLERVLPIYIRHYNEHRPHRSLQQRPPIPKPSPRSQTVVAIDRVRRRNVLGGLIHEYKAAA